MRLRPDLVLVPVASRLAQWWVVKDPVALKYHQLLPLEYELVQLLDGRRSLEEVRREFERRCAPHRLPKWRLQQFLSGLYQQGLVLVDGEDQGSHVLARRRKLALEELGRTLANPLAIRVRGIDPQRFLDALLPWVGWLYGPLGLAVGLLLMLAGGGILLSRLDAFLGALPDVNVLMSPANLPWTVAAIALVKVLHELGHGVACRRLGAECHELGVMFLVGVPCLYCNVSDAWTLRSRWDRAVVALAGIWVELLLASLAVLVWAFTYPGYVQLLSLNVIVVCSVSTILFNGNPLLRYDGYYALSDLLGVPNLGPRAGRMVTETLLRLWWGISTDSEPTLSSGSRWAFLIFGLASTLYRAFVTVLILWAVREALKPWNLEGLVWMIALVVVGAMLFFLGRNMTRTVQGELVAGNGSVRRGAWGGAAAIVVLGLLLLIPWPHFVRGPAIVESRQPASLYAAVGGQLVHSEPPGTHVKAGQAVARLRNDDLLRQLEDVEGRRDRQRTRVRGLESRRTDDPTAASQIPAARSSLTDLEEQARKVREQVDQLTLTAPRDGVVLPPPDRPRPQVVSTVELGTWTGSPLSPENRDVWLETGTLVCQIGNPDSLEAVTYVAQSDVEFLTTDQKASVLLDGRDALVSGKVTAVSPLNLSELPPDHVLPERLSVVTGPDGVRRLAEPGFQVRLALEAAPAIPLRSRARARIDAGRWTLGALLWRELNRTFRFQW